jgi:hypothetical protein
MLRKIILVGLMAVAATPALAQRESNLGEMVVTASRRPVAGYQQPVAAVVAQPHVVVFRRADNLIVGLEVECDTRDQSDRLSELRATLRNVVQAAEADGSIDLGVSDAEAGIVVPFRLESLDALLSPGQRADTSRVSIIVKTRIGEGDAFEAATGRIDAFIKRIKPVGRSQVSRSGDWQLTLVSPRQYRAEIVAAISKDANETAKAVGPEYRVVLQGLERQIGWSRSGPLELALYIPYTMTVTPAAVAR